MSAGVTTRGADFYVDAKVLKGGDGSAKAPFATIQAAADVAQAGDTVFIKPGTYAEAVKPKNSGKEGSPIIPPLSPPPIPVLSVSGAAGAKGISC